MSYRIAAVSGGYYAARTVLAFDILSYDFMNNAANNATSSACLDAYAAGNAACMYSYLAGYSSAYGIGNISVIAPGQHANASLAQYVRCFPHQFNGSAQTFCLALGG
ncbi:MAG: hypothetical protein M1354_03645 [Candidatus Marsarchaeota archaeon]|nr:hypothetical protein [Candidatus Marsarchaeota archaeon]